MLDDDARLLQGEEDLAVEQFVAQLAIEALAVAILPGAAGLDVEGLRADPCEPLAHDLGGELRAVVRTHMVWHATVDKRSLRRKRTSSAPSRRPTSIARHSRVYSSITVNMRSGLPSCVRCATKS